MKRLRKFFSQYEWVSRKELLMWAIAVPVGIAILWHRPGCASELVEMDVSIDGRSSISFFVGSAKIYGDKAQGTFTLKVDGKTYNIINSIHRASCKNGTGPLLISNLSEPGKVIGAYTWVDGDGSFGDTAAQVLCPLLKKEKVNPFKQTALTF
jgi:hypothetical protein